MTTLHVFTNENEWYVARDLDDAYLAMEEHSGTKREDVDRFDELLQMRDDESLGVICDGDGVISDEGDELVMTAAQWAKREGRGFLCSTNI